MRVTLTAAASALAALALACADGRAPAAPAAPAAPTTAAVPTPVPSIPVDAAVVHGANGVMQLGKGRGFLRVFADSTRRADGTLTVKATYQRYSGCKADPVTKQAVLRTCTLSWQKEQRLKPEAFTVDAALTTATLTDMVERKRLTVTWTAYGDETRDANNGYLLLRSREATGAFRWGAESYQQRRPAGSTRSEAPSRIFQRVTKP